MKTKEILNEWKSYLNKEILVEVSIKRFQEQHPDFNISSFNSQLRGNTDYLDIISNTINYGEQHGPDDYIQQFEFYKNSIEPNRKDQEFLTISIPGGETVSLIDKVNPGSCTATYDDIQQFQQARMFILGKASKNKLAAAYEKVLNEANENDFELIANDSNWIVFYPKSVRGSIALARSYWNGSRVVYDKTFNPSKGLGQNTGVIKWCTSVSGQGNMFNNYHRRLNLHMYYCINKNLNIANNPNRKLCISLKKVRGEVSYNDGSSSVNGNNKPVSEQKAKSYLGNIYNLLEKDASQNRRLEIDVKSYYESINVNQYVIMRKANEENIEDFIREFRQILDYSRESDKISIVAAKDPNSHIREVIARSRNSSLKTLELLANDSSENVRIYVAKNPNTSSEILALLADDSNENVRSGVAGNNNSPIEALKNLIDDKNKSVRISITRNDIFRDISYLEKDPTGFIIRKLVEDKSEAVREFVAGLKWIFMDNQFDDVVEKLTKDESRKVLFSLLSNIRSQKEIQEKRPQIIDKISSNITKDAFSYFKKINFKNEDLNELIDKFIKFRFCLIQHADIIVKFIIKKTKEGFTISSRNLYSLLNMLLDSESVILENERNQMHFAKLVLKSDFESQLLFLTREKITKKPYMYIAKKVLPAKGQGPGSVYADLHRDLKTYIMLQDSAVASMFVNSAQKSVLSKVFNKIAKLVNLKNNDEDLNNIEEPREYDLTISTYNFYDGYRNLSLEESIDLAIKAGPVLYRAVQNSPNAMSIKKNRFAFEKALKQQNLIESNEKSLEAFIKLVLS